MKTFFLAFAMICVSACMLSAEANSTPTVQYNALSFAARQSGQLDRYENVSCRSVTLKLPGSEIVFRVPRKMRAYDVVPIQYDLKHKSSGRKLAIAASAFEDPKRTGAKPLYDMSIPGDLRVNIEYLGSICADYSHDSYIPLTPDGKSPVSPFPPFKRDKMVRSSVIREAPIVWFKFKITNIGDTILDPEGFGASLAEPVIVKLKEDGSTEWTAGTVNSYERHLDYIYPGESFEIWVNYYTPDFGGEWCRGLKEGKYLLQFKMLYRYHREFNWGVNIWAGAEFARLEVPITVAKTGSQAPVTVRLKHTDTKEKIPGYIDSFEEFMSSFKIFEPSVTNNSGVIYLQPAPWTRQVTLKIIHNNPMDIAAVRVPVKVTGENLRIKYNPSNPMVIAKNGREEPVIEIQAMPGMRTGFQLGPFPEEHMLRDIQEMKDIGINLIANTAGGWWIPEITGRKGVELHSACYKHFYDTLVRKMGLTLKGWSVYPPSHIGWFEHAKPFFGGTIPQYSTSENVYGFYKGIDMGDPFLPEIIAAWVRFNYSRWGDLWFKTKDGQVPIDIEDSWGWMRDDINVRYSPGPLALKQFREWAAAKYGSVENLNAAWKSAYKSFEEINPEANQGIEGDGLKHGPVYNNPENVFHDWSPAVEDWDTFRTELRMSIYKKANEIIRKTIPGAELALRCEGGNLVIPGDAKGENMHWRHVYYSQRRNAMVYDVVKKSGVLHFYSDYTALPYTEAEWRFAMKEMAANGFIPGFLPQFDHMRDILLNDLYGREYKMHYNLDSPRKGIMIHCLVAAYPWWKATYEEGGAPGIIYSDYNCDGFATVTQKKEIKLLRAHFNKMKR